MFLLRRFKFSRPELPTSQNYPYSEPIINEAIQEFIKEEFHSIFLGIAQQIGKAFCFRFPPILEVKMPVQKTEAIVIRSRPLGEQDKIISFFTASFGKVRAVARGIKRPKSRFGGSLELLNYGDLVFFERPNKDLQIINSFDVSEPFSAVKDDLNKTAYSFYIAELIDATEAEGRANEAAFQLTIKALSIMKEITDVELLVHAFELQLLTLTGFKPQLYRCVACGGGLDDKQLRFSPPLGGMLCKDCFYRDASAISISLGTGKLMRKLQTIELPLLQFGATRPVKHELNRILSAFITFQLEKQFKSLDFIASLSETVR